MAKIFDFNRIYSIDKPKEKHAASYDKCWLFSVKERAGNNITFSSRDKNDGKDYNAQVLTSQQTGDEVCYITIDGVNYLVEAKNSFSKGRRLSELSKEERLRLLGLTVEAEWSEEKHNFVKTEECGNTFGEFIDKKTGKR